MLAASEKDSWDKHLPAKGGEAFRQRRSGRSSCSKGLQELKACGQWRQYGVPSSLAPA